MYQYILILDYGSQFTQLIARRIRDAGVYSEIYHGGIRGSFIHTQYQQHGLRGIILSGSYRSVHGEEALNIPEAVFEVGVPVLGICYGMQSMATHLGGKVSCSNSREFGYAEVCIQDKNPLFRGLKGKKVGKDNITIQVWMSHGEQVTEIPRGFKAIASTSSCPIAAMVNESRNFYALQFHPEVSHTSQGGVILERFAKDICGCAINWNMPDFIPKATKQIRDIVGKEEVILGLSGGLDSSVAAALIHKAVGEQLTCIFVDHGLLRLDEAENIKHSLRKIKGLKIVHIDASERFISALLGVSDPEEKRKIIGQRFIDAFQQEAAKYPAVKWLAQGTVYSDVVESAGTKTGTGSTIKSHHNVGGLPKVLNLKLLEPLRDLFKDEVKKLGEALGLPPEILYQHPFPGPGLGIRILGEITHEYITLLRRADSIFIEELRNSINPATNMSWYESSSQAFVVFLPIKSVGVMGDGRTYEYAVSLRAVQTTDFMTAKCVALPHSLLAKVASRIVNEVRGINRVLYDVTSKPPSTIEWE